MNTHLNRKRCLAKARGGDYVHPGEEEAIDIVLKKFKKDSSRLMLDVGCGLGGTAQYIKDQGYGTPICIDKEDDCIEYVNLSYPELETHVSDVIDLKKLFKPEQFDLAYLFNSFYAFPDQENSLKVIAELVKSKGDLVIFDYMTNSEYTGPHLFSSDRNGFMPIRQDKIVELLTNTGWHLEELVDMSKKYIVWYENLLKRLENKKDTLIQEIGQDTFDTINRNFNRLLDYLNSGQMSGCTIYAKKLV